MPSSSLGPLRQLGMTRRSQTIVRWCFFVFHVISAVLVSSGIMTGFAWLFAPVALAYIAWEFRIRRQAS